MSFTIQRGERRNTHVLLALAGASGSGKTFSAMQLAAGMCGSERFGVIDTEAGRALHYADQFAFDHIDMQPPFTPERYVEAIQTFANAGYGAIVIDSMSHEFDGSGGLMEMAEASSVKGPGAWKDPKMRHKKMMNTFLQTRAHLIFCLRAEEKIDMSKKDEKGRVIVENAGWFPIQEKRFMYEMTASFTLAPTAPGIIDMTLPHKVQDQHRLAFLPGTHISQEAGAALAAWAQGGTIDSPHKELWDRARRIAQEGTEHLRRFWKDVASQDERANLKPIVAELKRTAEQADANRADLAPEPEGEANG